MKLTHLKFAVWILRNTEVSFKGICDLGAMKRHNNMMNLLVNCLIFELLVQNCSNMLNSKIGSVLGRL